LPADLIDPPARFEPTPSDYAELANLQLDRVAAMLADPGQFEVSRYRQWRHRRTGLLVEAGYVYGEPWAKILSNDGRETLEHYRFTGHDDVEINKFFMKLG
jgi:hypothetical protein